MKIIKVYATQKPCKKSKRLSKRIIKDKNEKIKPNLGWREYNLAKRMVTTKDTRTYLVMLEKLPVMVGTIKAKALNIHQDQG